MITERLQKAINDQITTIVSWDNNNPQKTFAGEFAAQTELSLQNSNSTLLTKILLLASS